LIGTLEIAKITQKEDRHVSPIRSNAKNSHERRKLKKRTRGRPKVLGRGRKSVVVKEQKNLLCALLDVRTKNINLKPSFR